MTEEEKKNVIEANRLATISRVRARIEELLLVIPRLEAIRDAEADLDVRYYFLIALSEARTDLSSARKHLEDLER